MTARRALVLLVTTWVVTALPAAALAAPIELTAVPLLGAEAPPPFGWFGYSIRVRGQSGGITRGTVEVKSGEGGGSRAEFAVRPKDQVVFELYARDVYSLGASAIARDENGEVLAQVPLDNTLPQAPLLFDAGGPGRLVAALRDEKVATRVSSHVWAPPEGLALVVSRASTDARSGEPILPGRAFGYGAATVVLVRSEVLVGMPEANASALSDWVLSGGVLAVSVSRAEDLAHARLTRWIGAGVREVPSKEPAGSTAFDVVLEPGPSANEPTYGTRQVAPAPAVAAELAGYSGGRVVPSRFGASARSGLGTVHLLAFDPNAPAFVDDPWVRRSMVEMVRLAWDERTKVALVGSASGFQENRLETTRRHLDPNESGRWSVVVAAGLLLVYAMLAGPLSFRRAARSQNPLRALFELPLWSLGAVFLVVGIGAVSKGGRARARRLELVECASGEARCGAIRMRAFFASSADALSVSATEPSALLDIVSYGQSVARTLEIEHGRAHLEELRGRPWETMLVREDGFEDLGGSVTLKQEGKDFRLTNGLPRPLRAVIAMTASGDLVSFDRIAPGASVLGSAGNVITSFPPAPAAAVPGAPTFIPTRRLEVYRFSERANTLLPGSGSAWEAFEYVSNDGADWWPESVPTAIAEIEGGSGAKDDSGLRVDQDRRLIRVVGEAAP